MLQLYQKYSFKFHNKHLEIYIEILNYHLFDLKEFSQLQLCQRLTILPAETKELMYNLNLKVLHVVIIIANFEVVNPGVQSVVLHHWCVDAAATGLFTAGFTFLHTGTAVHAATLTASDTGRSVFPCRSQV